VSYDTVVTGTRDLEKMTNRQKVNLTLPDNVVDKFRTLHPNVRNAYIYKLRNAGWTLSSIAVAAQISRERVRQIVKLKPVDEYSPILVPLPPAKAERLPRVHAEPRPETLARLLALQPLAQKHRGSGTRYKSEAAEYTKLINHTRTVEGVTLYSLSKLLGVSNGALRFRLIRYGYMKTRTGKSKAYRPIKDSRPQD
jgi:hypothetical protein